MYQLTLDKFAGPLDLLLNMVEENKLSINEVSLADISDKYIQYLRSLDNMPKEELASFLVIAATLMLIKSRSLIPTLKLTEEEEVDIKELEGRLKMYKFFKSLSANIRDFSLAGKHLYGREAYSGLQSSGVFLPPSEVNLRILKQTISEILSLLSVKETLPDDSIKKVISMEEKMAELKNRIEYTMKITFDEIKRTSKDKVETIVSFLVTLELIKQGFWVFEQKVPFATIQFERKHE